MRQVLRLSKRGFIYTPEQVIGSINLENCGEERNRSAFYLTMHADLALLSSLIRLIRQG
ncbi:hypothetical protein J7K43_03625 [Candidatus Calescamantes bacterium]|nr:hypothetical protein [Candidatus Calescamantes bacterium]